MRPGRIIVLTFLNPEPQGRGFANQTIGHENTSECKVQPFCVRNAGAILNTCQTRFVEHGSMCRILEPGATGWDSNSVL
jgi:hypothetical protein